MGEAAGVLFGYKKACRLSTFSSHQMSGVIFTPRQPR